MHAHIMQIHMHTHDIMHDFTCIWGGLNDKSLTVHIVPIIILSSQLYRVIFLCLQLFNDPSMLQVRWWMRGPSTVATGRTRLLTLHKLGLLFLPACTVVPIAWFFYNADTGHSSTFGNYWVRKFNFCFGLFRVYVKNL